MNEVPPAILRWLEQKRRTDQTSAAVLSALAFASGTVTFLLSCVPIYLILILSSGGFFHPVPWIGLAALVLTAVVCFGSMRARQEEHQFRLDPMGLWIFKDLASIGPRLILEGVRQLRCCGQLEELNVAACAQALTYLATHNSAVNWVDLVRHCPQLTAACLKEQLSLLDGVLFLGEEAVRVTLMGPFRVRLRWMLGLNQEGGKAQEPSRPKPNPASHVLPVNEPEKLTAYELLGLSPLASVAQIKTAYRKRMKQCHPDLFAGMDQPAKALAERWTRALNAAYETLNPRHGHGRSNSTARR